MATDQDHIYMQYALQLAKKGIGKTHPNPMVGCVIVYQNRIIGQGWHHKAGTPHAEVNAINAVENKEWLKKAALYVTLEPCCHFGKTPPCTALILKMGIPKVIVGSRDANPIVAGKGIELLREQGCEVVEGVLETQCRLLNRAFFTFHEKKRPHIILKWAESADGYIAPKIEYRKKHQVYWLTGALAQQKAHQWRSQLAAILIGVQTLIDDDPLLTLRKWSGKAPQRCVIDPNHRAPTNASIFNDGEAVFYFTKTTNKQLQNAKQFLLPFKNPIQEVLQVLYQQNCISLLVEGGAKTLQSFIDQQMWDEIYKLKASKNLESGIAAPVIGISFEEQETLGEDIFYSAARNDSKAL